MNRNRKTIILTLKIVIGVACIWLIGLRLYNSYSPQNVDSLKAIFTPSNLSLLGFALFLMFINWGIEVRKWMIITEETEKISFKKAWESVWSGVCVGNLTPGRLGEFAGRMMYFLPENRAKVTTSHFVCGITQMIVTMTIGCAGLAFYAKGLSEGTWIVAMSLECVFLSLLLLVLFRINKVITWLINTSKLKRFNFEGLSYGRRMLLKLVGLSLIRYFVFSFQFLILLVACGVDGDILKLLAAISIMYLLLSTIPMISMVEVAVRAYVAVILFGYFNSNDWQLTAASTLLWFINIAVPSLIGYVFILKNKFTFSRNEVV